MLAQASIHASFPDSIGERGPCAEWQSPRSRRYRCTLAWMAACAAMTDWAAGAHYLVQADK
jgi:hypothetical protein